MKIKSEYTIFEECVERGINLGYTRAHKYTDEPSPNTIKDEILQAVTFEVSEYFLFDEETHG